MTTTKCNHNGCGKEFSAPTPGRARLALTLHNNRVHNRTVVNWDREGKNDPHRPRRTKIKVVHDSVDVLPSKRRLGRPPKKTVQGRTWKEFQAEREPDTGAHFCPCCGFNLAILSMAMRVAAKLGKAMR